ncbi:hypothetical protein BDZ94DRAFT_1306883 [Collybia nuda]|uniref:Uncharacterized protein n=1 Tax=Collybia nuda TaxID=64659 RepID=A0A9P5YBV7_9AGAR|nr:hypothetical protein BDZ94DRAFT_1306883 [Collybia nuda]
MTPCEFTALAKTQIYSHVSDMFINDLAAAQGNQTLPTTTKRQPPSNGEDDGPSEGDNSGNSTDNHVVNPGGMARSVDDDRNEIKKRFKKLFCTHGLTVTTFPWKNLLGQLLKWRVQIVGWPADVPFPSETVTFDEKQGKKCLSQGIKSLLSTPVQMLLTALMDPAEPIQIISGMSQKDLEQEKEPLIVCGPPPYGSQYRSGRRQFAGGRIDHRGPPAVGPSPATTKIRKRPDKKTMGKPPPPDVEIVDISKTSSPPSARTRFRSNRRHKPKIILDSENETDNDNAPLVPSSTVTRQHSPGRAVDVESNDSDPEGANTIDPHDTDFKQLEDDQSEGEVRQRSPRKSPKKVGKGKGKGRTEENPVEEVLHKVKEPTPTVPATTTAIVEDTSIQTFETTLDPAPTNQRPSPLVGASIASREARIRRAIESLGQPGPGIRHIDEHPAKKPRLDSAGGGHAPSNAPGAGDGACSPSLLAPQATPAAHPRAGHAQPREPSHAPSNGPSATSRTSSRAPSAPPRVPSTMSITGPWLPPGHPSAHPYPPNTYAYPQMQHPPPRVGIPEAVESPDPEGMAIYRTFVEAVEGVDFPSQRITMKPLPITRVTHSTDPPTTQQKDTTGSTDTRTVTKAIPATPPTTHRPSRYPGGHNTLDYPMEYADDNGKSDSMQGMTTEAWTDVQAGETSADAK